MTLQAGGEFSPEPHIANLNRDGYTIIDDFIDPPTLAEIRAGLAPHLGHHRGRNAFEGFKTERVYTLVGRGRVFERLTEEPRLLSILDRFLQPHYLLTASQAICIYPDEAAQAVHTDDSFYPVPRPRPAISLTMIAAVDPFTNANGCTEIAPGSHRNSHEENRRLSATCGWDERLIPLEMQAGACGIFLGTLVHRGGANRSNAPRLAVTNQYCEPWARTQENFYLSIPPELVRPMSPRLKELLGYSIWPPFMGMVTAHHPINALDEAFVAPVAAEPRN